MEAWSSDAYYIPGLHTKPLCDEDPNIAPSLNPLRESLQKLVGRPVNFSGHVESRSLWPRRFVWRGLLRRRSIR